MIRYYCSGFGNNVFGQGLGEMIRNELTDTKSIVYIPGGLNEFERVKNESVPEWRNDFKKANIVFENEIIINSNMNQFEAQKKVESANFVMLMGGNPFKQKLLCEKLALIECLKNFKGIMMGYSAGAMLMSKYIIVTPCSDEYPTFQIENGLNLDGISIYPHNNTSNEQYPDILVNEYEKYRKEDLIKVAKEYGDYYLLQDNLRDDGKTDVSIIKSVNGILEKYIEESGKIWIANKDGIVLKIDKYLER